MNVRRKIVKGMVFGSFSYCLGKGNLMDLFFSKKGAVEQQNDGSSPHAPSGVMTIWQLPEQGHSQMMSYLIAGQNGKIIVIDGGTKAETAYLRNFIHTLGSTVDIWFVSHPHFDHVEALNEILSEPVGISIKRVVAVLPSVDWLHQYCNDDAVKETENLLELTSRQDIPLCTASAGQYFFLDGILIQVLRIWDPAITPNGVNNASMVLKIEDRKKSLLVTGDLGVEAGEQLLHSRYSNRLRCDYVQMAHHGQAGVSEDFYAVAEPDYCLWPTPAWLWENDNGGGRDSGPWKTLDVYWWMKKKSGLNVIM